MKNNKQAYCKSIYPEAIIKTAINDYRRIAAISLADEDDHYMCSFCNCIVDSQRVINEFDNYLIELMNSRGENTEL